MVITMSFKQAVGEVTISSNLSVSVSVSLSSFRGCPSPPLPENSRSPTLKYGTPGDTESSRVSTLTVIAGFSDCARELG